MGRTDEHQSLDILRVVQSILQRQDASQGDTAQMDRSTDLGAVCFKGGEKVGVTGLMAVQNGRQFQAQNVLLMVQIRDGFLPAGRLVAGAVNQNRLFHRRLPQIALFPVILSHPCWEVQKQHLISPFARMIFNSANVTIH